jgi:peptide deformylase
MKLTRRVLHKPAKPAEFEYPERNRLLEMDMHRFMVQENGIGLAAPQIGISLRVFVMQMQGWRRTCFNPEITGRSDHWVDFDEGCLSFPGEHCIINRPEWVDVRYQDYQGQWHSERFSGILARCFQHELDHLDGITMWDRHKEQHAKQSGN